MNTIGTTQEQRNVNRITQQRRAGDLLYRFCELGFNSYDGFKSICMFYDKSLSTDDAKQFWQLSHLITSDLSNKVERVIVKLKKDKKKVNDSKNELVDNLKTH